MSGVWLVGLQTIVAIAGEGITRDPLIHAKKWAVVSGVRRRTGPGTCGRRQCRADLTSATRDVSMRGTRCGCSARTKHGRCGPTSCRSCSDALKAQRTRRIIPGIDHGRIDYFVPMWRDDYEELTGRFAEFHQALHVFCDTWELTR